MVKITTGLSSLGNRVIVSIVGSFHLAEVDCASFEVIDLSS